MKIATVDAEINTKNDVSKVRFKAFIYSKNGWKLKYMYKQQ